MAGRRLVRGRSTQWLRRLTQLSVVLFVIWGAMDVWWRNYKVAHNHPRLVALMEGDFWGRAYALNERLLEWWGGAGEAYQASLDFLGLPWAATVAGVPTADPILVMAVGLKAGFESSMLLGLLLPLGIAALLGKLFCSHLCPMRLAFEVGQWIRGGLLYVGVPVFQLRAPARLGGWVLLGGLIGTLLGSTAIWLFILPYVGLSASIFLGITGGIVGGLLTAVAVLLTVDVLLAPGQFCHAICPTGWLLEQVGRASAWKLGKREAAPPCPTGCVACIRACPYTLSPKTLEHFPGCDNCGQCVPACPDGKLVRRLGLPRLAPVFIAFALAAPGIAEAHHNKGLPHYGYFENYPQVPTEEVVVVDGRWEFGATIFNFQGLDRRASDTPNDVKFYTYVYDLEADKPYTGPLTVRVELDGEVVTRFTREAPDEETTYLSRETLPASGEYGLVAEVEGAEIVLPFQIDLADDLNWPLIIGLGLPVGLVFLLALLGRTRRGKARLQKLRSGGGAALLLTLIPSAARAEEVALRDALVDCADPLSVNHYIVRSYGESKMVMAGMPPLYFAAGMALIILVSFALIELIGARQPGTWRKNLIKNRRVYRFLRGRLFPALPQLLMVGALAFLVYAGLMGSRARNITPVAVWTIWWAGLIFAVAFVGPIFCTVCPWDGLANLASRLRAFARVDTISLNLPVPAILRTVWPASILFIGLTWMELGLGTTTDPRQTAYLGLAMAAMAVLGALLFPKKAFCDAFCPVGRISGMYANFSPFEIRARNPRTCRTCTTEDCLNGNERGYACPTGITLKTIPDATQCTWCFECVKSCNRHNVAFNLRPFAAELHSVRPRNDHAWLAILLLALTLFHGLSMTTAWENPLPGQDSLLKWMGLTLGTGRVFNFSLAMALATALPVGLFAVSCWVAARWSGSEVGTLFRRYAFALLPVALFYHLAHNAMHLLMEGGAIVPLLSDPLGTGADYFGTAGVRVGHLLAEDTLWIVQLGLVLVGHLVAVVVAHRVSRALFTDTRRAFKSLLPMTLTMVVLSVAGLTLMAMDMSMTLGRT